MALQTIAATALLSCLATGSPAASRRATEDLGVKIDWNKFLRTSETTATLQAVMQPPMARTSRTHDDIWTTLRESSANFVRFQGWFPYPKVIVPEIDPPAIEDDKCSTSWNFTLLDQAIEDYFKSTPNVSHSIALTTSPAWMWISNTTYTYPEDPNTPDFKYNNGTELRDPTFKEISEYYARIVSWYVNGGFIDECGVYHESGHSYTFDYWEILNEVDYEHSISAEYYTGIYDAVVAAVQPVSPKTEFVGVNFAGQNVTYFEYFLNHDNHKPGVPLDHVAFHFYAYPYNATGQAAQCYVQADDWITDMVAKVEAVRDKLSPETKINLNEVGVILPNFSNTPAPNGTIPDEYWVWSGGVYAYLWSRAILTGIEGVGASQLSGIVGNFPEVSLVNQTTGTANARMRVLQLIQDNFGPGDAIYHTTSSNATLVHVQAFKTSAGERKLLVINKDPAPKTIEVPGFDCGTVQVVDLTTQGAIWRTEFIHGTTWVIPGYATAVLTERRFHSNLEV